MRRALAEVDLSRFDPLSFPVAEYHAATAYVAACSRDAVAWNRHHGFARQVYGAMHAAPFVRWSFADQAWQAISLGDLRLAETLLERALATSPESASTVNDVPLTLAYALCCAGRFDAARAALEGVFPSDLLSCREVVALVEVELALATGDDAALDAAIRLPLLAELARQATFGFVRLSTRFAAACARLGRRTEARTLLEGAVVQIRTTLGLVPAMLAVAELAPDLARPLRPLLAETAADPFCAAALALFDAELARHDGDAAGGERCAAVALAAFERLGWPAFAARAARIGGRTNDALAIYRRIGHVAGVRGLAAAEAIREESTPGRPDVLTARERELALLVAAGKTNRDAAGSMDVSEKTVEKYLTSIYAKLSLSSRLQLARFVNAEAAEAGVGPEALSSPRGGPPSPVP